MYISHVVWLTFSFVLPVISGCFQPSLPFPPPVLTADDPNLISLFTNLRKKIQSTLKSSQQAWNTTITSFAIEVTSANDKIWELYHTAPILGTDAFCREPTVSGNSYFRVASISKVFTVLAILLQEKEGRLNLKDPISKYIPELSQDNATDGIQWNLISLESLASQLSGIPRECRRKRSLL